MDLILWRHADALDVAAGGDDMDRPLSARGEQQAQAMAVWLMQQLPADARILVSPARRTQQTAAALQRAFTTVEALGTAGSVSGLLFAAGWPAAVEPVLVVGHQPTLGSVASLLLSGTASSQSVAKGAVWWLRGRGDGSGRADLVTVREPGQA